MLLCRAHIPRPQAGIVQRPEDRLTSHQIANFPSDLLFQRRDSLIQRERTVKIFQDFLNQLDERLLLKLFIFKILSTTKFRRSYAEDCPAS